MNQPPYPNPLDPNALDLYHTAVNDNFAPSPWKYGSAPRSYAPSSLPAPPVAKAPVFSLPTPPTSGTRIDLHPGPFKPTGGPSPRPEVPATNVGAAGAAPPNFLNPGGGFNQNDVIDAIAKRFGY